MDVAIIICTYNRADNLRRTLEVMCALQVPADLQWEVVVVDNNSTDATRAVCVEVGGRLPLRYIFEPRQGKSHALNRAVAETTAPLLTFTDDDVDVDGEWLLHIWDAAQRHPQASFFGGRILPRWEAPPPRWLAQNSARLLRGVAVHYDSGKTEHLLSGKVKLLCFGANLVLRRSVFDRGIHFPEHVGPNGEIPMRGEETELMQQILALGNHGVYVPNALVHHRNPAQRMTERYLREWFTGYGMTEVRLGHVRRGLCVFGAPLRVWFKFGWYSAVYGLSRWTLPSRIWLRAEVKSATRLGIIQEFRRRHTV